MFSSTPSSACQRCRAPASSVWQAAATRLEITGSPYIMAAVNAISTPQPIATPKIPTSPMPHRPRASWSESENLIVIISSLCFLFHVSKVVSSVLWVLSFLVCFSGGRLISVTGHNLDVVQEPRMVVTVSPLESVSQSKRRKRRRRKRSGEQGENSAKPLGSSAMMMYDPACPGDPSCPVKQVCVCWFVNLRIKIKLLFLLSISSAPSLSH